jgi:hypothetical protein
MEKWLTKRFVGGLYTVQTHHCHHLQVGFLMIPKHVAAIQKSIIYWKIVLEEFDDNVFTGFILCAQ